MSLPFVEQMTTACPAPPCHTLHPGHTPTGRSPRATQTTAVSGTHRPHLYPHPRRCHPSSNWGPGTAIERRTWLTCKSWITEAEMIGLTLHLMYDCMSLQQYIRAVWSAEPLKICSLDVEDVVVLLWQEWMGTSWKESGHKKVPRRAQEYIWVWAWKVLYFGAWKTCEYIKTNFLSDKLSF